ncbi:hypothetical protein THICB3560273 [Thiomonas sp. CB3]|nr:hypothetical protein THICB3560273 [Thiomonas sp. CB3]
MIERQTLLLRQSSQFPHHRRNATCRRQGAHPGGVVGARWWRRGEPAMVLQRMQAHGLLPQIALQGLQQQEPSAGYQRKDKADEARDAKTPDMPRQPFHGISSAWMWTSKG